MLFNSYTYLLLFLPFAVAVYFFLSRYQSTRLATSWLVGASLFFYAFWNPLYLPLLLGSVGFNYVIGKILTQAQFQYFSKKLLLTLGISGNIGLLLYFKYADFFIENFNTFSGGTVNTLNLILPLAISFFTFQQITYLVDSYRGTVSEHSFMRYLLFVSFFPQLIAGPIVHHKEMMPQFFSRGGGNSRINYINITTGLFILFLGLFKKVVIADTFAVWASAGFAAPYALGFLDAWITSLSYTLQLYFDFSGYTDMALGAALMFNIYLPLNFNSPYKARNIQDFWQRWHMTLSRFLREYLYIPLGGSRKSEVRTGVNVATVFLLGGLWHGAAWTFVVWGGLHGAGIVVFNLWKRVGIALPKAVAWLLTFLFITVGWVFFRADTFSDAFGVLRGMSGVNGFSLSVFNQSISPLATTLFGSAQFVTAVSGAEVFLWLVVFLAVVIFAKNSMELSKRFRPTVPFLILMLALVLTSLYAMNNISEFIYFNF